MLVGYIDHHHASQVVDLGRCKPDTGSLIHGFKHVIDQFTQRIIELINRLRLVAQQGIRKVEYIQNCHWFTVNL